MSNEPQTISLQPTQFFQLSSHSPLPALSHHHTRFVLGQQLIASRSVQSSPVLRASRRRTSRPFAHPRHANLPLRRTRFCRVPLITRGPPVSAVRPTSAVRSCTYHRPVCAGLPPPRIASIHAPLTLLCHRFSRPEASALRFAIFDISPPQGLYIPGPAISRLSKAPPSLRTSLRVAPTKPRGYGSIVRGRSATPSLKLGLAH